MRQAFNVAVLGAMLVGSLVISAAPAVAEETTCTGSIGARTVDNLRVPQGKSCSLNGTTVEGTIKVERGATLQAKGVRVIGNIQAENHKLVVVNGGSRIGGSIQLDQGGAFRIVDVRAQNIQVKANAGESYLRANRVNADVQVFNHSGGVEISRNHIDGNLQCKENTPAPTGGGNTVQGNKEDQCRGL